MTNPCVGIDGGQKSRSPFAAIKQTIGRHLHRYGNQKQINARNMALPLRRITPKKLYKNRFNLFVYLFTRMKLINFMYIMIFELI
jgi:hypothetical protein